MFDNNFDWNKLNVEQDGERVVAPCISFTIWFQVTVRPTLLDFYERIMDAYGSLFTHYQADRMKWPAKVTPRSFTLVPTWLKKPAEFKFYYAGFRGSKDIHGTSFEIHFQEYDPRTPKQVEMLKKSLPALLEQGFLSATGLSTTTFRVTLPVDHPLGAPDTFSKWVFDIDAVRRGEFVTGGIDYSLNYEYGRGNVVVREARALCMRYPGLHFQEDAIHMWLHRYEPETQEILPLSKRAGWITLLNERSVDYLGGEETLKQKLSEDPTTKLYSLAHGTAIQAGDAPRLGDLSRIDIPYRNVAAAIRPVRIERVGSVLYPDEWMGEWLDMLDVPLPEERS
jgi:hypothetical protein